MRWCAALSLCLLGCTEPEPARPVAAQVSPAVVVEAEGPPPVEPTPTLEPTPTPVHSRADALELTFVGDLVLGRYLEPHGKQVFVEMHPPDADPFTHVAALLEADVLIGNLESPVVRELPLRSPISHRNRFASSAAHLGQLSRAGFDVLSLANNHFFDLGVPGQREGPQVVAEAGMRAIGASHSESPLLRIETHEFDGWRIGFLAFTTVRNHPGERGGLSVPFASFAELDDFEPTLAAARADHDLLIAMVHWGEEYSAEVDRSQRLAARELLRVGVDLVIGHHPHVLQALERHASGDVRDGLIAYSLGNFLFPRNDSGTEMSGVLRVRYRAVDEQRPCLEQARLHSVFISRRGGWHPEPAPEVIFQRVRKRMVPLSEQHGTRLRVEDHDLVVEGLRACE